MGLVVRTRRQSRWGTWYKLRERLPVAQQAGDGVGGNNLPGADPLVEGLLGGFLAACQVDLAGQGPGPLLIADAEALGDVAEEVDPAGLAGTVG